MPSFTVIRTAYPYSLQISKKVRLLYFTDPMTTLKAILDIGEKLCHRGRTPVGF